MENNGNGVAFEHFPYLPVGETVRLYQLRYMLNNRLAVVAVRDGDTEGCPILLTANIPNAELSAPGRTFFDTRLRASSTAGRCIITSVSRQGGRWSWTSASIPRWSLTGMF